MLVIALESADLGERAVVTLRVGGMDLDLLNHGGGVGEEEVDLWNLHLNEPWWVVGEQRHWPVPAAPFCVEPIDPFPPLGDVVVVVVVVLTLILVVSLESISFAAAREKRSFEIPKG